MMLWCSISASLIPSSAHKRASNMAPEEVAEAPVPFFLYLSYTVPHAGGWGDAPSSPEDGNPVPSDLGYGNHSWPAVEKASTGAPNPVVAQRA